MFGPRILVSSMIPRAGTFAHGNSWQYHSRSDHHSKIACWGLLFDLLRHCPLLRDHARKGLVGYGLNHEMRDFRTSRKKNLDLVICRPRNAEWGGAPAPTFADQADEIGAVMDADSRRELATLPTVAELPVGAVHIALEAKACMTAFSKAKPRLFDELNSSHAAIHGNSPHTIAAGLAMVNMADTFISPGRNDFDMRERAAVVTRHRQPRNAAEIVSKLRELPRRSRAGEEGYDAFGIIVVRCRNDGSAVELIGAPPAPQLGETDHYEMTVHRLAQLYQQKYHAIE